MFTPPVAVSQTDVPNGPSDDQIAAPNVDLQPDMSGVSNIATTAQQSAAPVAQAPQGSKWARVAQGALAGFLEGGIPDAVGGAIDPAQAQQVKQQQILNRDAQMQRTRLAMNSAVQDAQLHAQNNDVQMATAALNIRHINALANGQLPPEFRSQLTQEGAQAAQHLIESGINPVFKGDQNDAAYHQLARQSVNSDNPIGVITLPMADGSFAVFEVPNNDRAFSHAVDITIGYDSAGKPITQHYEPGQISIARALSLESAAIVDRAKDQSKIAYADAIGLTNKNNAAANKANAAASGTGSPKVENLLVGMDAAGNQVAGTKEELAGVGVKNISKLPTADASKVVAARELVSPDGLFSLIAKDMAALGPQGLDALGSRFNEFMAGKVGAGDDNYTRLRTHVRLLSSALMQAHVGSRGSEAMLDEFRGLADAGKMNSQTLTSALRAEYDYVHGRALLPRKAAQ